MSSSSEIKIWVNPEEVRELELPKRDKSKPPESIITPSETYDMYTVFQKIKNIPADHDDVLQQIDDLLQMMIPLQSQKQKPNWHLLSHH